MSCPTLENQLANARRAAVQLSGLALKRNLVLTHGNGPQVGLLALQSAAYGSASAYPLDVLGVAGRSFAWRALEPNTCCENAAG